MPGQFVGLKDLINDPGIRYALSRMPKTRPYLDNGFLELDNRFAAIFSNSTIKSKDVLNFPVALFGE